MTRFRVLLSGLAFMLGTVPASYSQDISGAWSFRTEIKRKGCTIVGNMSIAPAHEDGIRTCSFVSSETCDLDPETSWQVEQSCRIIPSGPKYLIRSKVIGSLTEGYTASSYAPDHFIVEPDTPAQMHGLWQDRNFTAPVLFWRDEALPIS